MKKIFQFVTSFFKKNRQQTKNNNWQKEFDRIAENYTKNYRLNYEKSVMELEHLKTHFYITPEESRMLEQTFINNPIEMDRLSFSNPKIAEIMSGNKKDIMRFLVNKEDPSLRFREERYRKPRTRPVSEGYKIDVEAKENRIFSDENLNNYFNY